MQTGSYRGRRFVGFTLDLSNWTGTRSERIKQIEFWTAPGRQKARRARLIYEPGASERPAAVDSSENAALDLEDELVGEWDQTNIFQLLSSAPEAGTAKPVETVELKADPPA